jgi:hypothetical protein
MMHQQARSLRHCARWILASCCTPAKFIFWSFKNSFLCFFLSALGMWAPSEFHFLFGKKLWAPSYPCFFSIVSILVGARGSAQVVGVLDGRTRRRSRRRQRSDTILVAGVLAWAAAPRKTGERDCHHVYWNNKEVTEIQLNRRDCAQSPVTLHDTRVLALYSNSCNWQTHTHDYNAYSNLKQPKAAHRLLPLQLLPRFLLAYVYTTILQKGKRTNGDCITTKKQELECNVLATCAQLFIVLQY